MKNTWFLIAATALLASCKESATTSSNPTATPTGVPSETLARVLAAAPAGAPMSIHEIRNSAQPGDTITVSGRIMGNSRPFVEGRAVFILGDPTILTPCNEIPGDECDTPWDACCDTPEQKKQGTATIQIVDAEGRVLKEAVEGVGGLEKLAHVTVAGTVAQGSSPDLLLINADAIRLGK
jgi:hypothetical protein